MPILFIDFMIHENLTKMIRMSILLFEGFLLVAVASSLHFHRNITMKILFMFLSIFVAIQSQYPPPQMAPVILPFVKGI